MKNLPSLLICLVLLLLSLLPTRARADQRQVVDDIAKELKNKLVILSGFYAGDKLQFDSAGNLIGKAKPGYWTSDGMLEISSVALDKRHGRLVIRGTRIINGFDPAKCHFTNILSNRSFKIGVELDPAWQDIDPVEKTLAKVIVRDFSDLKNLVPDYWRSWFGTVSRRNKDGHPWCETADSHGIATPPFSDTVSATLAKQDAATAPVPVFVLPDGTKAFELGFGIKPPKAIHAPDPAYTDIAKRSLVQGTSILWVVVNEQGVPTNIRIAQPLGAGLDDRAIETVEQWRFKPATYNGTPVAVRIGVVISFRVY